MAFKFWFPNLYRLSSKHNALVAEFGLEAYYEGGWNFFFRRNVRDCELEELMELLECLNNFRLNAALEDKRLWLSESSHIFSCKSDFNELRETPNTRAFFPFKLIWKSPIPHKIKVFAWLVALGRVNTCDVLQKKRPNTMLYPSWCVLCKREEETVDHLFIQCSFTSRIWWKILHTFGLYWVVPGSCYGLLSGQGRIHYRKSGKDYLHPVPSCNIMGYLGGKK